MLMINQKKNHLFSSVKNQNLKSLILMNQLFFLQIVLTNKKSSMMLKLLPQNPGMILDLVVIIK